MSPDPTGKAAPMLTLPHGDPVAVELTRAIHGGDLDALGRLVDERPELATVHMIGRKGVEGGWRTPLHAAADGPATFPRLRPQSRCSSRQGLTRTTTPAVTAR